MSVPAFVRAERSKMIGIGTAHRGGSDERDIIFRHVGPPDLMDALSGFESLRSQLVK